MSEDQKESRRRTRLIESLDRMVESGRVTQDEAVRLRAARGDAEAFDSVATEIRVRHATPKLMAAVERGKMTQTEADIALEQLRAGEHPRSLRARLHGVVPSRSRH